RHRRAGLVGRPPRCRRAAAGGERSHHPAVPPTPARPEHRTPAHPPGRGRDEALLADGSGHATRQAGRRGPLPPRARPLNRDEVLTQLRARITWTTRATTSAPRATPATAV